jgi:5-dehydro-4-deoxyglucarate dehydratase
MKSIAMKGILGFPIAPYNQQGRIDEIAFVTNIQFLVHAGLDAIFVCAGSSEYQSLDVAEYEWMVDAAVSAVNHKVPVFVGTGGNIIHAQQLAGIAAKKGADGLLILPPYLIEPEQEGLYRYYKTIIESSSLASIIYQRDNAIFTVDTVSRLCELPQVVGFKDGHGNIELNTELTRVIGVRLNWMNGMPFAEVTMPIYKSLGFQSYSSAMSNYLPHISRMFYQALSDHNEPLIQELYEICLLPIHRIRKQRKGYAVSLIKAGMEIVGLPVGSSVRAPLIEVEKEHYKQLESIITRVLDRYPSL